MKKLLIVVVLLVVGAGMYLVFFRSTAQPQPTPNTPEVAACTKELKVCPDGTGVGRTGSNCEFAACPNVSFYGELSVGETKTVNGVEITVNKIVEESRCPQDVVCIQAGRFVASVTLSTAISHGQHNIGTDKPQVFGDKSVSITNAIPFPVSTKSVDPEDYRITFKVQ